MLVKRIRIKFNKQLFDKFYAHNNNSWPPNIEIYSETSHRQVYRVEELPGLGCYKVFGYLEYIKYNIIPEEKLYMCIPEYFLDIFTDLEIYPGGQESYYSV